MHFSDTCKANSLSFSSIEKKRHFVNLFIVSMSGLGLLLILVTALFFAFEKITYRTVIHMNDSHAEEIDSFSEFVSSSLFSGAEQISCSSSVRALMAEPSYTNGTELNQHLTELCAYVDAADYLDGIYVWNPYNNIVYSTDQNRAQQSLDELQPSVLRNFSVIRTHMPKTRLSTLLMTKRITLPSCFAKRIFLPKASAAVCFW